MYQIARSSNHNNTRESGNLLYARFCTFDPFLRLAMINPPVWLVLPTDWVGSKDKRPTPRRFYPEDKLYIGA